MIVNTLATMAVGLLPVAVMFASRGFGRRLAERLTK